VLVTLVSQAVQLNELVRDLQVGLLRIGADVVDLAHVALVQNDVKGASDVLHVDKRALVLTIAVQSAGEERKRKYVSQRASVTTRATTETHRGRPLLRRQVNLGMSFSGY